MSARKINKGSLAYEVNVALKKSRVNAKRKRRNQRRIKKGKKPLAQPLRIALGEERTQARRNGKMVFYDGKRRIEFPLSLSLEGGAILNFQGVFKTSNGRIVSVRSNSTKLFLFDVTPQGKEFISTFKEGLFRVPHSFSIETDLAHMEIDGRIRRQGLGLKLASKAEKHRRAKQKGVHKLTIGHMSQFLPLFEKLGYSLTQHSNWGDTLQKSGKHQPKDDLSKFHRIEAIDPKTGKARIFTFRIRD